MGSGKETFVSLENQSGLKISKAWIVDDKDGIRKFLIYKISYQKFSDSMTNFWDSNKTGMAIPIASESLKILLLFLLNNVYVENLVPSSGPMFGD